MTETQIAVIRLIEAALTEQKTDMPTQFDIAAVADVAQKHQIVPLIYYGAKTCGISDEDAYVKQLFQLTCAHVMYSTQQMYEISRLFDAFDAENIDYMPLKGVLLKAMYPRPEMRVMSDADILIRFEQYPENIIPIMQNLGFQEGRVSDNELVWEKPRAYIELHKRLVPSYNKDYYAYYGDGWRLAKVQSGTRYHMTDEDQFIFLFTHFSKHYRDAGIGIRHLVDLWVYQNQHKNMDAAYIKEQLTLLQLYDFYQNVEKTLRVWFAKEQPDPVSELITQTVFSSGVFGTEEVRALSGALKLSKQTGKSKQLRRANLLREMFPPYAYMCSRYPFLRKQKWLLPFFWVVRLIDALLFRKQNLEQKKTQLQYIQDDNVSAYQQALRAVGLDFNFQEKS